MEASERDTPQDWLLSDEAKPPLLSELVERIDEAVAVARASEKAIDAVGETAIEAAVRAREAAAQARRAAQGAHEAAASAERAAERMTEDRRQIRLDSPPPPSDDPSLRGFSDRADRLVTRLKALQRVPLRPGGRSRVG
jgi:septal ring factor EnvC (AmiA/AmiB activator)